MKKDEQLPLFRLIIPAFPEVNIFSRIASKTTALGPVMVATAASKLWGWRVELIDENNYRKGPLDESDFPDHKLLQAQRPAKVVGFYCGLSSTMPRVWQLAKFYQAFGVTTIAGSWHTHYNPQESLRESIDIVVHGDGETAIRQILTSLEEDKPIKDIPGISFMDDRGRLNSNLPEMLEVANLNTLPYPRFDLIRYAKIKIYPIGRVRGCSRNCEFCSVKGNPRCASGQFLFDQVQWLVETRGGREFFIVDDRLEEDKDNTMIFFQKIAQKYGRYLDFTVQARLEAAEDTNLLTTMKKAGVRVICIGYESPIDEDLRAMRKGYSFKDMLRWTKIYHKFGFFIHAMFIYGYPSKQVSGLTLSAKERTRIFKSFIHKANLDTVQILRPIPLIGTDLRERLKSENRLIPLETVPWDRYDGNYVCYRPNNMTLRELQETPTKLMKRFYNRMSLLRIPLNIIVFPIDFLIRGWFRWYRDWRNNIKKYGGHIMIRRWLKRYKKDRFMDKLEKIESSFDKVEN